MFWAQSVIQLWYVMELIGDTIIYLMQCTIFPINIFNSVYSPSCVVPVIKYCQLFFRFIRHNLSVRKQSANFSLSHRNLRNIILILSCPLVLSLHTVFRSVCIHCSPFVLWSVVSISMHGSSPSLYLGLYLIWHPALCYWSKCDRHRGIRNLELRDKY